MKRIETTAAFNMASESVIIDRKNQLFGGQTWFWRRSWAFFGISRETVRSEISNPSFSNSPWIRGAPHSGFAAAIVRTQLRISALTDGRPGAFDCDNRRQYRLNRWRCQEITISGRTIISADFQSFQIILNPIQNSRSRPRSLGRLTSRLNTPTAAEAPRFLTRPVSDH